MSESVKRERKSIDRFVPSEAPKEVAKFEIQKGKGQKLEEFENVTKMLEKSKGSDDIIENVHMLLYKTKGKTPNRKKNIRAFSGMTFDKNVEEEEKVKLLNRINKYSVGHLNSVLDFFGISKGKNEDGSKEKKAERLISFLMKPEQQLSKKATSQLKKTPSKSPKSASKPASASKKTPAKTNLSVKTPIKKNAKTPQKQKTPTTKKTPNKEDGKSLKRKNDTEGGSASKKNKNATPSDETITSDVQVLMKAAMDASEEISINNIYNKLASKYDVPLKDIKVKKVIIKEAVQPFMEGDVAETKSMDAVTVDEPESKTNSVAENPSPKVSDKMPIEEVNNDVATTATSSQPVVTTPDSKVEGNDAGKSEESPTSSPPSNENENTSNNDAEDNNSNTVAQEDNETQKNNDQCDTTSADNTKMQE